MQPKSETMYSAVPNRQEAGTTANFEEKVPPQEAFLALLMHDNLTPPPRLRKMQKNPGTLI